MGREIAEYVPANIFRLKSMKCKCFMPLDSPLSVAEQTVFYQLLRFQHLFMPGGSPVATQGKMPAVQGWHLSGGHGGAQPFSGGGA